MSDPKSPEEIIVAAIEVLQRELPGGALSAREAIAQLWGLLESPAAREIYERSIAQRDAGTHHP